jgi:hypothetical protein
MALALRLAFLVLDLEEMQSRSETHKEQLLYQGAARAEARLLQTHAMAPAPLAPRFLHRRATYARWRRAHLLDGHWPT